MGLYIGITIVVAMISSFLIVGITNRFFKLYQYNVKQAFRTYYGNDFMPIEDGMQDYTPEDSEEEEAL